MKKRAFTLIELIVYMGVLSLLSFFIFDYWSIVQKSMIPSIEVPTIGLEILRRDLAQASSLNSEWSPRISELIFKKKRLGHDGTLITFSVGWKIDKERLVRTNGIYDFHAYRWLEKRSAVVSNNAKSFAWKCNRSCDENIVEAVEVAYTPKDSGPVEIVVRLRNRALS